MQGTNALLKYSVPLLCYISEVHIVLFTVLHLRGEYCTFTIAHHRGTFYYTFNRHIHFKRRKQEVKKCWLMFGNSLALMSFCSCYWTKIKHYFNTVCKTRFKPFRRRYLKDMILVDKTILIYLSNRFYFYLTVAPPQHLVVLLYHVLRCF